MAPQAVTRSLDVHDDGMVQQPVQQGGDGHGGVMKDAVRGREGLIGGDQQAAPLIAPGDQLEEHAGLGLVFAGAAEVVEDQEVELVELGQSGGKRELAAGDLQPLDEVDRSAEQDAVAVVDQGKAEGRGDVRLADPRRAEDQDVGTLLKPGIPGGERQDVRLAMAASTRARFVYPDIFCQPIRPCAAMSWR